MKFLVCPFTTRPGADPPFPPRPNSLSQPGTCGKLLSSMEARLVDPDGKDVKEGEAGELWIRGRNIMM